jgi:diguanylate cyclase (GGDEF)-like protein
MLAAMPTDDGLGGALIVGNRLGLGGEFDAHDLRLFGTLAAHAGAALGQDKLGQRVSELREAKDHLYHQAFHDGLTGLANRLLFMDRIDHALSRRGGNIAVLYIDLDDFKPVNDTLGHEAGDELLRATATRLRASLRAADTPARLGGDEFAVLLVDIEPEHVLTVAGRILSSFAEPVDLGGRSAAIHASMGIAMADSGALTAAEVVRNADVAMYTCKHGGKRGYAVYGEADVTDAQRARGHAGAGG